jgi:hypothetical protein
MDVSISYDMYIDILYNFIRFSILNFHAITY